MYNNYNQVSNWNTRIDSTDGLLRNIPVLLLDTYQISTIFDTIYTIHTCDYQSLLFSATSFFTFIEFFQYIVDFPLIGNYCTEYCDKYFDIILLQ